MRKQMTPEQRARALRSSKHGGAFLLRQMIKKNVLFKTLLANTGWSAKRAEAILLGKCIWRTTDLEGAAKTVGIEPPIFWTRSGMDLLKAGNSITLGEGDAFAVELYEDEVQAILALRKNRKEGDRWPLTPDEMARLAAALGQDVKA